MTSQTGQQIIKILILLKILRGKDKKTMKFGQLINNNMRNIFLEKSSIKHCGEDSLGLIYKNQN